MRKQPIRAVETKPEGGRLMPAIVLDERSSLFNLRKKHAESGQGAISAKDSRTMLVEGNASIHMVTLERKGVRPRERQDIIDSGKAHYLVVACSDARNPTLDAEKDGTDLVGVQMRVAGNVLHAQGVSLDEIREAASHVQEGGLLLIVAHVHCGAVKEYVKWKEGGEQPTGSEPLDSLLHSVGGETPKENALAQLEKLKGIAGERNQNVAAVLYDWEGGTVELLSSEPPDIVGSLIAKWRVWHQSANKDGKLGERLSATQKPHAIVVGANNLPFSVDTIFAASQNEIFSTTGSEGGLDYHDEASVLYAVEHLGSKHIAFVAHGRDHEVGTMFYKWEQDLRRMGSVAEKLDSGEVTLTCYKYDLDNGRVAQIS
jgi:carbonic anhydrase